MGDFTLFNEVRNNSSRSAKEINNFEVLGCDSGTRGVHIAWMFPDVLSMHGGRGDAMALMHFSNLMKLPCTIRRVNTLTEEIPFDWADMMLFPSGDISVMEDVSRALKTKKEEFLKFGDSGKVILVVGSTGALLADKTVFQDGNEIEGLGLLHMIMKQRVKVHGDDLWITLPDGKELFGTQIQLADVGLQKGQAPFGKVVYGRGNHGKKHEGARTKNVIFTHLLGPVLSKNPIFTAELLKLAAKSAGLDTDGIVLEEKDYLLEKAALEDHKTFIKKKIDG